MDNKESNFYEDVRNVNFPKYQTVPLWAPSNKETASSTTEFKPTHQCSGTPMFKYSPVPANDMMISQSGPSTSLELEGHLIDSAIDNVQNLPKAVEEVAAMQKDLTLEIGRHQKMLEYVKQCMQEEEKKSSNVTKDIDAVTRKLFFCQDKNCEKAKVCDKLKSEISKLTFTLSDYKCQIREEKRSLDLELEEFKKYEEKMRTFRGKTSEAEADSAINQQLLRQRQIVEELRKHKKALDGGPDKMQRIRNEKNVLHLEICSLMKEKDKLEKLLESANIQVKEEEDKQARIKQETAVLHKRNAAQLTRLKRQLKEGQARNRQLGEQKMHLGQNILQCKKQITRTSY